MTQDEFAREWRVNDNYIEVRTSGSTGTPKTIKLSKHDMELSARATCGFFQINSNSTLYCPLDYEYIAAKMMYVRAIVTGATLLSQNPSNDIHVTGHVDLLAAVPSQIASICDAVETHRLKLRHLIIGGAPLNSQQHELCARLSAFTEVWHTYGMTETASHIALAHITLNTPQNALLYHALSGVTFTSDRRGCLIIEMTGRDINHIETNDVVEIISPTSFHWIGRFDNVINSGGIKIHPEVLESVVKTTLDSLKIAYTEVLVTSETSTLWGEQAVCLIETTAILNEATIAEIRNGVEHRLDDRRYCPKKFVAVTQLERTANGKLRRKKL